MFNKASAVSNKYLSWNFIMVVTYEFCKIHTVSVCLLHWVDQQIWDDWISAILLTRQILLDSLPEPQIYINNF